MLKLHELGQTLSTIFQHLSFLKILDLPPVNCGRMNYSTANGKYLPKIIIKGISGNVCWNKWGLVQEVDWHPSDRNPGLEIIQRFSQILEGNGVEMKILPGIALFKPLPDI